MTNRDQLRGGLRAAALLLVAVLGAAPAAAQERGVRLVEVPNEIREAESFDASGSAGLFVGVRHFDDTDFAEVPYAVDDAVDLAYLFAFQLRLISPRRLVLALAGEPQKPESQTRLETLLRAGANRRPATRREIFRQLERLGKRSEKKGIFVVSLATHGFSVGGADFLNASDSLRHRVESSGIAVAKVFEAVTEARSPRRLLLLDACREKLSTSIRGTDPDGAMGRQLADAIADAEGLAVLSATTLGGYSYDDSDRGNGVFTAAVLEGLSGAAGADPRGFITLQLLAEFVDREVLEWVERYRPSHIELSRGISMRLEMQSITNLPLSVAPEPGARGLLKSEAEIDSSIADLSGDWIGFFYTSPHLYQLDLALFPVHDNREGGYQGTMRIRPLKMPRRTNRNTLMGDLDVKIEYRHETGALRFEPAGKMDRTGRASKLSTAEGVYVESLDSFVGVFQPWKRTRNSFIFFARKGRAEPLIAAMSASLETKRSRWVVRGPDRERANQWADRYVEEFPGTSPNNIVINRLMVHATKLYRDRDFVPFFGKPYDQLSGRERTAIEQALRKRDPVDGDTRNSFAALGLSTSYVPSITVAVRAMRITDVWLQERSRQIEHLPLDAKSRPLAEAILAQAERMHPAFWPSEIEALRARVTEVSTATD